MHCFLNIRRTNERPKPFTVWGGSQAHAGSQTLVRARRHFPATGGSQPCWSSLWEPLSSLALACIWPSTGFLANCKTRQGLRSESKQARVGWWLPGSHTSTPYLQTPRTVGTPRELKVKLWPEDPSWWWNYHWLLWVMGSSPSLSFLPSLNKIHWTPAVSFFFSSSWETEQVLPLFSPHKHFQRE